MDNVKQTVIEVSSIDDKGNRSTRSSISRSSSSRVITSGNVLELVLLVLLIVTVLFTLLSKEVPTLGWLLETLQGVPKIDTSWIATVFSFDLPKLEILGVNLLGWLQPLINVFKALAFIGTAIVQCATFLFYIILRLF